MASWDEALTFAMRAHRWGIAEEGVAASLMRDLGNSEMAF
jgi:predicted HD phosphohydrolase